MVETSRTLRRFLSQRRAQALLVAPACAVLWEAVADQVGGKLVRPRLTVASYLGAPAATGKSVLSDLRAGKRTELLRLTYLLTDDDGRAVLARHVGNPDLDDDGAEAVRRVMLRCGARDHLSTFVDELGERNH